ncbi:hypothetical protein FSP39_007719 [Pinctada imbricata]|uniref:Uncharacterized protein n=1 Tax=Pinctada imbricata TaxID=66713 RepID=A0AA88XYM6_PINIB|nr:hypothetical protein FSP39_007719 [Pinctada imbricata]
MTKKGLINRGDSYSSKGSLSSTGSLKRRERIPSDNSETSVTTTCSGTSSQNTGYYRIAVFGRSGVGKQSLVNQLMTSDYVGGLGSLQDLSNNEKCVSVLLDGEESTLEFRDLLHEKESISQIPADAYVIVFSVDDKRSFCDARDTVTYLRNDLGSDRAIVLVANKIDLVRKRQVTAADAKTVAVAYNCKYIETSATLNHQVDELLVCVLRQIRLLLDPSICSSSLNKPIKNDKKHSGLRKSKGFLSRFFRKNATDSRSCDNLFEL